MLAVLVALTVLGATAFALAAGGNDEGEALDTGVETTTTTEAPSSTSTSSTASTSSTSTSSSTTTTVAEPVATTASTTTTTEPQPPPPTEPPPPEEQLVTTGVVAANEGRDGGLHVAARMESTTQPGLYLLTMDVTTSEGGLLNVILRGAGFGDIFNDTCRSLPAPDEIQLVWSVGLTQPGPADLSLYVDTNGCDGAVHPPGRPPAAVRQPLGAGR